MTLASRITSRQVTVAVVGLGYVGLPLCRAFHDAGVRVIGLDIDAKKIELLRAGRGYLNHLGERFVAEMSESGRFEPTSDPEALARADAILICVPTPLGRHLEPDLSFIVSTVDQIAKHLRPGQLVVLESTTYPGTTREVVLPRLKATGLVCGNEKGFYLAFSPEREDPGRKDQSTATIPKLVGGIDEASTMIAADLYRLAIKSVVEVRSTEVAESAKLLENIYRSVNIAMVNEMKLVLSEMGIDIWEVIAAASTKPFGFHPFYPGPGLGGHCIPIDPYYLAWKAREMGMPTRFIELAGEINHAMPRHVVDRVSQALNERGRPVKGSRVLVLGLAYKKDIDDVRESPSFVIIERLAELGAKVDYNDPHVSRTHAMRKHNLGMQSVPLSGEMLAGYDAVVIATDHSAYDWQMISANARLIIDTRNACGGIANPRAEIIKA